MTQISQIQQRFTKVMQVIDYAAQECRSVSNLPHDFRECVRQLDLRAELTQQVIQSKDKTRIRECVDELEEWSDRTERAMERAPAIDDDLRDAVLQAHSELANLRHHLH